MTRRLSGWFAVVLLAAVAGCCLAATPDQPPETERRDSIKLRGKTALLAGDFDGFEKLANEYRSTQERTPAGAWKLWLLYKGINILFDRPDDPGWDRLEAQLQQWLQRSPSSPTATIVTAKTFYLHGWAYRGEGYGGEVGAANRARYKQLVAHARQILDGHSDVARLDPEWDTLRVAIAREEGASSSTVMEMATAALLRQPYYPPTQYATANSLLPKWGGSEELVQEWVRRAVQHSTEKEGTQAYARIYFDLASNAAESPLDALNLYGAKWPQMKQSLDELVRAHPDPFNIEIARVMACLGGDKSMYVAFRQRTVESLPPVAWWDSVGERHACDDWGLRGLHSRDPLSVRVRMYVYFFIGEGFPYWRNVGLVALLIIVLTEGGLWWLASRGPRSVQDGWWASANQAGAWNPLDYPRSYRKSPRAVLRANRLGVGLCCFSLAAVWSLCSIPWPDPLEQTTVVVLLLLVAGAALAPWVRGIRALVRN